MSCVLEVNDGSSLKEIRSILSDGKGKGLELEGTLVKSLGKEQAFELQVSNMKVVGFCDAVSALDLFSSRMEPRSSLTPHNTSAACITTVVGSFLLNTVPGTIDGERKA
ncbi:hypothetical protein B0O80DRAFT_427750 [Mortierella sp. GBAus27b]|nr:hypothetical protein B0O80DRAFT_427750 [Mortierella sp. GBAus27b]